MLVIKRDGDKEDFSSNKLFSTLIKLFGYIDDEITPMDEFIAGTISGKMEYVNKKDNIEAITSDDVRKFAIKELIYYGREDVAKLFSIKEDMLKNKDSIEG